MNATQEAESYIIGRFGTPRFAIDVIAGNARTSRAMVRALSDRDVPPAVIAALLAERARIHSTTHRANLRNGRAIAEAAAHDCLAFIHRAREVRARAMKAAFH